MKELHDISKLCARALQIVQETPPDGPNEAARFQWMCDRLEREFRDVPEKRIRAVVQFYDERRGMF